MERILFVTSTRIGDAVLSSGVLAHLVETRPDASFTVAAGPLAAPLFRATPRLEELIVMTKRRSGSHWFDLWRRTAGRAWDLVVDLRGSRTSWFLRAKERRLAGRPRDDRHKVLEAAEVLGLAPPPSPVLWLDGHARAEADAALPEGAPILALAPAASSQFKTWPAERFAELAAALTGPGGVMAGARIALFGGPGDAAISRAAAVGLAPDRVFDLTGRLDLPAVGACLKRARLFVGNDSGLMHMAAAAGAPTIGLFGPTDERLYGPWGAACRAVRAGAQVDARLRDAVKGREETLLDDLSVARVLETAAALVAETEAKDGHG